MAQKYLALALIIQSSLVLASNVDVKEPLDAIAVEEGEGHRNDLKQPEVDDMVVLDPKEAHPDWMDMFYMPNGNIYPSSSAAIMAHITENATNKTAEEQLKDIKEIANKITMAVQNELANLLAFALTACEKNDKDKEDVKSENQLRKKRETPMDSAQMVMRLLKHIKANNDYQNIAIEKMMTAQEIADKYGIEFYPDPEILSDLAVAANGQAKELTSVLSDACDGRNVTKQVKFVPVEKETYPPKENNNYYVYSVHHPEPTPAVYAQSYPAYEYMPEPIHRPVNHVKHTPYETQIPSPHHQHYPTTPKPTFYDTVMPEYYQSYCPVEPITTTTTIVLPFEEIPEPEPQLVGEEYEETVTSKVTVDHDEPGASTVNHVMTYTLSEKSHFKNPEIENLPQQMQYTFFLM